MKALILFKSILFIFFILTNSGYNHVEDSISIQLHRPVEKTHTDSKNSRLVYSSFENIEGIKEQPHFDPVPVLHNKKYIYSHKAVFKRPSFPNTKKGLKYRYHLIQPRSPPSLS